MDAIHNFGLLVLVVVLYIQVGHALIPGVRLQRIGLGCVLGATTVLTMSMPFELSPGVFVDARCVPMALAGLFAGGIGTAVTLGVAVAYCLARNAPGAIECISALAVIAAVGLGVSWRLSRGGKSLRYVHLVAVGALAVAIVHISAFLFTPTEVASGFVVEMTISVSLVTFAGIPILGGLLLQEERKSEIESRLARSEAQYRLLADHATDMITRFDLNFLRKYVSPGSKRLYGYEPEMLVGERTVNRIHPDDLPAINAARQLMRDGTERVVVQYRFRHRDGGWIWTEATLAKNVDPETGLVDVVSVARDISERKLVEEELREANAAKSRFLAAMSHELRTPLNAVIGFAEIIRDELFGRHASEKYREYAIDIEESGRHLLHLIDEVLDLSKIEAGKMELNEEMFDPAELIESSLRLLEPRAEKGGVALESIPLRIAESCRGDLHRLRQALLNLLSNAIKFTPPGGSVSVSGALDHEGRFVIRVRDSGCGIAAEDMKRLFKPFSQARDATVRSSEGTGLGLTLARDFAELHDGQVWLESRLGEGTTAFLTLPASRMSREVRAA